MKRVLCLSGGGAKGIAQLQVLRQLEKDFNKPLCECYDLIGATSVGAINGSLIATGKISMDELDELYFEFLEKIFKRKRFFRTPLYDRNNFLDVWENIIGEDFLMADVKTKLMLTSVEIVSNTNRFFKSWKPDDGREQLSEFVCRSFAAPLYFGYIIDFLNKKIYADGGIGSANLPLDEVKLQSEVFNWYDNGPNESDNKVIIDVIGSLYSENDSSFERLARNRWLGQILQMIKPKDGGMARFQSREDQVRKMKFISENNPNISFRYWDHPVDKKANKLNGVEYKEYYKELGKIMAKNPIIDIN